MVGWMGKGGFMLWRCHVQGVGMGMGMGVGCVG